MRVDETSALILTGFTFFVFGAVFLQRRIMTFYNDAFGLLSSFFFFPTLVLALFFGWLPLIEVVFNINLLELLGETGSIANMLISGYDMSPSEQKIALIITSVMAISPATIIYLRVLMKCPRGRKFGVGISMCVCFFGIMMKISLIISVGILFFIFLGSLPNVLVFWVPKDKI